MAGRAKKWLEKGYVKTFNWSGAALHGADCNGKRTATSAIILLRLSVGQVLLSETCDVGSKWARD